MICFSDDMMKMFSETRNCIIYLIYIGLFLSCFICHTVFYIMAVKNDLTGYNCSDEITNEVIRKGFEDSTKNIINIKINYYLEIVLFVCNVFAIIISVIMDKKIRYKSDEDGKSKEKREEEEEEGEDVDDDMNEKSETKNTGVPLISYETPISTPTPSESSTFNYIIN